MPAAAEPGPPPTNIRNPYTRRVSGFRLSVGVTEKPHVLGVTAW